MDGVREVKDKPLLQATLGDFWRAGIEMGFVDAGKGQPFNNCKGYQEKPWIVVGIKSLAKELQVSISTVNRMLAEGVIDHATYQYGKTLLFNVNGVLEALRRDK